jgi:hypothetical protein
VRDLIFNGGFEQGFAQGEASREALSHHQLDLAFQQGHAAALATPAVREAFDEGYRKGKGKGEHKGFTEGWECLQELRVGDTVHEYLTRLVDEDERRCRAEGEMAERASIWNIRCARTHLADIEPRAPDRSEAEGMLEALRRARTRSPRWRRALAADRQHQAGF